MRAATKACDWLVAEALASASPIGSVLSDF